MEAIFVKNLMASEQSSIVGSGKCTYWVVFGSDMLSMLIKTNSSPEHEVLIHLIIIGTKRLSLLFYNLQFNKTKNTLANHILSWFKITKQRLNQHQTLTKTVVHFCIL